jgi:hypothetical protein
MNISKIILLIFVIGFLISCSSLVASGVENKSDDNQANGIYLYDESQENDDMGVDVEILNQIAAERDSQRLIELLSNYSDNLRLTSESLIVIGGPQNVFVAHAGAPPFLTGYDMPGNFMEWIDSHGQ